MEKTIIIHKFSFLSFLTFIFITFSLRSAWFTKKPL